MLSAPESAFIFFIALAIIIFLILLLITIHCILQCRNYQDESENINSDLFDIIDLDKLIGRYEFIEKERLKRQSTARNVYQQNITPFEYLKDKMFDNEIYDDDIEGIKKFSISTQESTLPIYSTIDEEKGKIVEDRLKQLREWRRTWKGLDDYDLNGELKEVTLPMYNDTGCQTTETLDKITAKEILKNLLRMRKTIHALETLV